MNKLAEKGFAISARQKEAVVTALGGESKPEVFEIVQQEHRKEPTLRVLDAEAFNRALGEGAHTVQGGLEGHRHFEACTIVIREVEKRQEAKPNGTNGNGEKAADPIAAKIVPRASSGRTLTGEVHGYTLHVRENKCAVCGEELKAKDGHYHEYLTDGGQGVPDVMCCACKGHGGTMKAEKLGRTE